MLVNNFYRIAAGRGAFGELKDAVGAEVDFEIVQKFLFGI